MKFHTFNFFCKVFFSAIFSPLILSNHWNHSLEDLDVLIISDHTILQNFNLDTSGFDGIERTFVDPSIKLFEKICTEIGLDAAILNIEDLAPNHSIYSRQQQDIIYNHYDKILLEAAENDVTIISLHLDAEKIEINDFSQIPYPTNEDQESFIYEGGAQLILEQDKFSNETLEFAHRLLFSRFLDLIESQGVTIRPTYQTRLRLQQNISMSIAGQSKGGAILIELGALDELKRLFVTPENIAVNLSDPLRVVANTIAAHRKAHWLK